MSEHTRNAKVREATVSGIFYPEGRSELRSAVAALLGAAELPSHGEARDEGARSLGEGRVEAIMAPHAGFAYAGDLAAVAWKSAADREITTVLAIAPLHRAEEASIYLPESVYFKTPLGDVPVDRALVDEMMDCGTIFAENDIPHFEEHGIEVQLPFMQYLFPEAALVPLLLGQATPAAVKALASAIDLVFGERLDSTLILLSSDLSSGNESSAVAARAESFLRLVAEGDWKGLLEMGRGSDGAACGAGCVAAYLASSASRGAKALLLGRHDSASLRQSEQERLVNYGALAFVRAP
jgi:AmmeMemoRadiSam system protein B